MLWIKIRHDSWKESGLGRTGLGAQKCFSYSGQENLMGEVTLEQGAAGCDSKSGRAKTLELEHAW
jgi:hypothetical protein